MTVLCGCNGGSTLDDVEIKLIRPSGDTVTNGIVPIQVAVSGGEADRVEILIDGSSLAELTTIYQVNWDSSSVPEGAYAIGARAHIGDQQLDSDTVQVVVDRTTPEVAGVSPEPGSDIERNDPIELTLTESIDPTSLTQTSFELIGANTGAINLVVQLSADGTKITLAADTEIQIPDTLTLTLNAGLADLAGNTISANTWEWSIPTWRQIGANISLSANALVSNTQLSRLSDETLIASFMASTGTSPKSFHVQTQIDGSWTDLTESIEITSIESDRVNFFGQNTNDMVATWRSNSGVEVRRWNGAQWLVLNPTGVFQGVHVDPAATITSDGVLYVVADAGTDCTAIRVASHDGSSWSILGDGPHPSVECPNGSPAVAMIANKLTILGHSGETVWISQWDGSSFTPPNEAMVAASVTRLDDPVLLASSTGGAALFVQDGKLTARILGENGWFKPGQGQLNMRLDLREAKVLDASLSNSGILSVLFTDYTPRTYGAATEQTYLAHWEDSWNHTSLGRLKGSAMGLDYDEGNLPIVVAYTDTTLTVYEKQDSIPEQAIVRPTTANPCGPFLGDLDDPTSGFPQTLTETGCYTDLANRVVVEHAVPYDVNANLFSDTALKRRLIIVPENEAATYTDIDGWNFPVGTIIIKEFTIHSIIDDPTSEVIPMETRFMIRNESADWTVASYKWSADGSEGFLRDDIAETEQWAVYDNEAAQEATHTHIYPSRSQCYQCHGTNPDDSTLGLETAQLNRAFDYNGVVKNQLEAWMDAGMLTGSPESHATRLPWNPSATDTTESLDSRFRAYLHVNCAHCHYENPSTCGDMRYATPLEDSGICDQVDTNILTDSMLYQRMVLRFPGPMPQLGTSYADPLAIELVNEWLESQTDCAE